MGPRDEADRRGAPLLEVDRLTVELRSSRGVARIADGVSFHVELGEVVGLVGESGCGKSITALSLARLQPPVARIVSGTVLLEGEELTALPERALARRRGSGIAYVPQDPGSALNPVMRAGAQVASVVKSAGRAAGREASEVVASLFRRVGLEASDRLLRAYPHELSGGMRQRVALAAALAAGPRLLVADEPTTALDTTIQREVVALLRDLVAAGDLGGVLLITHDVGVIAALSHRVLVMYAGRIVEESGCDRLFASPRHPYTKALLDSLPGPAGERGPGRAIPGRVPDLYVMPTGCPFHPRCPVAEPACEESLPELRAAGEASEGRRAACHLVEPVAGTPGEER